MLAPVMAHRALAAGRPMTIDDLLAVKGVSDPQLSPDGSLVVYVVSELDRATDKTNSSLWLVPASGGEPKRLTTAPGTNNHPRWSPDGKTIAFVSSRGGSSQVWLLPIDGGEPRQLTKLPIDVSGPIWSPKGDKIAFTAEVYPGQTPEQTAAKDKEKEASKSKVRIYDHLMIRHWNAWDEGKRSHLFVADAADRRGEGPDAQARGQHPPCPVRRLVRLRLVARRQGARLHRRAGSRTRPGRPTPTSGPSPPTGGEPKNLTEANQGADAQPAYSPDGKWLAYVSQARAGFESDQWVLKVLVASRRISHRVDEVAGSPGPVVRLGLEAERDPRDHRRHGDRADRRDRASASSPTGRRRPPSRPSQFPRLVTGGVQSGLNVNAKTGKMVFTRHNAATPAEVYIAEADGSGLTQLTHHNAPLLAQLDLPKLEGFAFPGPTATRSTAGCSARRGSTRARNTRSSS